MKMDYNPEQFDVKSKNELQEMSLDSRKKYIEERNREIYLRKMGLKNTTDTEPTYKRESFTLLSQKFGVCITWLQYIIKKEREKYAK